MELTQNAARALMVAAQGLDRRARRRAGKADVLAAIRRMGVLQIDTISVVARSPYLVLWSRLGAYEPRWLDELLAEGALFEYWAHEACFIPVEDFALFRHRMLDPAAMGWKYRAEFIRKNREAVYRLLANVRERGPVRSADFERRDGKGGGWWEWKPEKRMLESLFTAGELMIARRDNFHRVYDVRERVLPSWSDDQLSTREAVARELALKAVRALGVAKAKWVADYFRTSKRATPPIPARLADEGALLPVRVEGWKEPGYVHPDHHDLALRAAAGEIRPTLTTLLSPFDPLVWDRARDAELFGFDYRLECYTPAPKRRWGYFVLPILRRGALVGRLDAKAHRRDGVFEVRALYLEPGVRPTDRFVADVAGALRECAAWHGTPEVTVRQSDPPELAARLMQLAAPSNAPDTS
ncbi:MAG TPA: crosslink repair DNA glycosylase YcaQ family protein [Longimicrobium sp.]